MDPESRARELKHRVVQTLEDVVREKRESIFQLPYLGLQDRGVPGSCEHRRMRPLTDVPWKTARRARTSLYMLISELQGSLGLLDCGTLWLFFIRGPSFRPLSLLLSPVSSPPIYWDVCGESKGKTLGLGSGYSVKRQ